MRNGTWIIVSGLLLLSWSCTDPAVGPRGLPTTATAERAQFEPELLAACPGLEVSNLVHDYVPDSVTNSGDCKGWLASKESYHCAAFHWFDQASSLGPDGLDWPARQSAMRKAVARRIRS